MCLTSLSAGGQQSASERQNQHARFWSPEAFQQRAVIEPSSGAAISNTAISRKTGGSKPSDVRGGAYLDEGVEESEGQDDHGGEGRRYQHDDADLHQLKDVAQHHLQALGDHAVDGVDLFGEAVEEVAAGRALEERHGRVKDVEQQVHVQVAGGDDAADGDGHGGAEDGDAWRERRNSFVESCRRQMNIKVFFYNALLLTDLVQSPELQTRSASGRCRSGCH